MRLLLWLRSLFHREQVERELDEELQFHLSRQVERRTRRDMRHYAIWGQ